MYILYMHDRLRVKYKRLFYGESKSKKEKKIRNEYFISDFGWGYIRENYILHMCVCARLEKHIK